MFTKAQLICKDKKDETLQNDHNKDYLTFLKKINEIKNFLNILNQMRKIGCKPDDTFYFPINLKTMSDSHDVKLTNKLEKAQEQKNKWESYMLSIFNQIDLTQEVKYLTSFFSGINFLKTNALNIEHFFKFIDPEVNLNLLDMSGIYFFSINKRFKKILKQ